MHITRQLKLLLVSLPIAEPQCNPRRQQRSDVMPIDPNRADLENYSMREHEEEQYLREGETPECNAWFKHIGIHCTDPNKNPYDFACALERHRNLLLSENIRLIRLVEKISSEQIESEKAFKLMVKTIESTEGKIASLESDYKTLVKHMTDSVESDSVLGSCNCDTKTPEIQFHKAGCKYRLISERDELRKKQKRWDSNLHTPENYGLKPKIP